MSIQYKAAIVVGAVWDNMYTPDNELYNKIEQLVDDGEFDDFPPCYDGGREGVFGYELKKTLSHCYSEINISDFIDEVFALKRQFLAKTGIEAKVYLTPVGY